MCPLFRKATIKVCHDCELWDHIRGRHPQTGADMDHWACAFRMQTLIAIEQTQAQRQTTASIDAFRNETHAANDQSMVGAISRLNQQMDAAVQLAGSQPMKLIEN